MIAVVIVIVALVIWWMTRPRPVEVRTALVREVATGAGGERTVLNASGYVTARREATVSSKVTGKVAEVLIEEGVRVEVGQVLARLDDTNVQASLHLARAQLAAAESGLEETRVRLTEAEREFARQQSLLNSAVASQSEFERAEAGLGALRARLALQQADVAVAARSLAVWEQQLEDTIIRAPFAGIVTSKNAQPGEMISPMSSGGFTRTGICTVVDMESLEIEIDVSESYINRVKPDQPVEATLDAYSDWRIPCKVIAIIPTADREKSTVRVRVGFVQLDPRILPQMAVKVAFQEAAGVQPAGARSAVIVPRSAVRNQEGRDVVFVIRDGRAERRAVTVAGTRGTESEISAGLSSGEKIAVEPPAGLVDGASVGERNL
ncbi:MAG TPA: efflux RND transporter periplasmic adaptor subunit [Opitutaceae bacterium]|nr:efflux RND transporter periplasmic adaptor subunit [Opitutaceae bacterium]